MNVNHDVRLLNCWCWKWCWSCKPNQAESGSNQKLNCTLMRRLCDKSNIHHLD